MDKCKWVIACGQKHTSYVYITDCYRWFVAKDIPESDECPHCGRKIELEEE